MAKNTGTVKKTVTVEETVKPTTEEGVTSTNDVNSIDETVNKAEESTTGESQEVAKNEATEGPVDEAGKDASETDMTPVSEGTPSTDSKESTTDTVETKPVDVVPTSVEASPIDHADEKVSVEVASENTATTVDQSTTSDEPVDAGVEADPLPEVEGHYYVKVGDNLTELKQDIVETRLERAGFSVIVTATGTILVGPYATENDAVAGKRKLLSKGLRGNIVIL